MTVTYMLRTCDKDMRAYNGFVWPENGPVSAPDWNPEPVCGGGLHGLLMGIGDISCLSRGSNAKWLVVAVDSGSVVDLDGKVKVPSGNVVYCGDRDGAVSFLVQNGGDVTKIPFTYQRCGYGSTLTGGDCSTLTGGDYSTLTGGDWSTLTGGYGSTLTGGYWSTLTGGNGSTLTGGNGSTLTGGDYSTLTGGDYSTLTGGNDSTLIAKYWDEKQSRYRFVIGEVCDGGLRAGIAYRCVDGIFVTA
jgi:hypothetical protein